MKLIKERGYNEDEWKWFWVTKENVMMSPSFPKQSLALEWYTMHEEWMENDRPPVFDPEERG